MLSERIWVALQTKVPINIKFIFWKKKRHCTFISWPVDCHIKIGWCKCKLWQSPVGKQALSHWASMLRWIWSISEYNLMTRDSRKQTRKNGLLGGIIHHKPTPQNMCHTHSWPQHKPQTSLQSHWLWWTMGYWPFNVAKVSKVFFSSEC